jgi:MFS family permease
MTETIARDQRRVLAVTTGATLLVMIAFTIPLATLASTARGLGSGPGGQAWILSSMSIGLAVALLVSGAVGDDYGRRAVLTAGGAILAATSLVAALAGDTAVLVAARIGQGIGGAAILSCSLGLIAHTFPAGPRRARATGMWGASLGAGIAIGPVLASWLDDEVSWQAGYWLLAVLSAVLVVAAPVLLTECRSDRPRPVDLAGALLLGGGLVALLAGLVEGRASWARPVVVALLAASVVLMIGFAVRESRARAPMLDLGLFRTADFVISIVAALANGAGVIALMSFLSTFLQRALGYTASQAALAIFAWSGVSVAAALLARRLPARFSVRARLVASLLVIAAGQVLLVGLSATSTPLRLLPGLLVAGVGSGVLNAALAQIAVLSVPAGRSSLGSGANNTARYVGSALGVTVVSVIAAATTPAGLVDGWNRAVLVTAAVSLVGALVVLRARSRTTA